MYGLKKKLTEEEERLRMIEKKLTARLKNAPEGTLRISKSNNRIQYYHCQEGDIRKNGKYIKKSEEELACSLARKSYDEKVLRLVKRRLQQIGQLSDEYQDNEIEKIYQDENVIRQGMISPVEMTWEQLEGKWISEEYENKEFKEGDIIIYSEKGERVRSKSEKILADTFFHNRIPYKYEKALYLKGFGVVYPDFTFLSKKTGNEIYWEHEGRMDDPNYAETAIKKIKTYENNRIYPGERLILTFETKNTILNTADIERNIKRYLI